LLGIALSAGGAVGVRDTALGLTAISLAFSVPDALTLDRYFAKKSVSPAAVPATR
jgi:hypothetical protein